MTVNDSIKEFEKLDTEGRLRAWWNRDGVIKSVQHNPKMHKEFLEEDSVNQSMNRIFDDTRALRDEDTLYIMNRDVVEAPLVKEQESDVYQSLSKEAQNILDLVFEDRIIEPLMKTAAAYLAQDEQVISAIADAIHNGADYGTD